MNRLTAGTVAPDFELPDQNGTVVKLSSLQGKKVLVYFYPKAMTPGCTTQACALRDSNAELEKRNLVILGISPDSPVRLKKFEARDELNFTLLADEEHKVADAFGVWGLKKFMGREYMGINRTTFLIDEKGRIEKVIEKVDTENSTQQILQ